MLGDKRGQVGRTSVRMKERGDSFCVSSNVHTGTRLNDA